MPMDSISRLMGELVANQKNMQSTLTRIDNKVDVLKDFQSATEERLIHGNKKFIEHSKGIDKNEELIIDLEKQVPTKRFVFTSIYIGFVILGLLITFFSLKNNVSRETATISAETVESLK